MVKATLVLEGGANRGVFTSGVLDYLMGKELYMSNVIGVSAGACNAVDYVSKQAGRSRECVIHREKEYDYVYGLKKTLKEKNYREDELPDLDQQLESLPDESGYHDQKKKAEGKSRSRRTDGEPKKKAERSSLKNGKKHRQKEAEPVRKKRSR